MEKVFTALGILLVLIIILYLSYICTKYVGNKARVGGFGSSAQNIRVVEQRMMGRESSVAIIQAGNRFLLVGVTPQKVNLLTELDEESLSSESLMMEEDKYAVNFKDMLQKFRDRK